MAIDHKVKSFQHHDAQKNVLAKHHGRYLYLSPEHFYRHHLSQIDFLNTPIGVFCICTPETHES